MRSLSLLVLLASSTTLAQGRPRVPAHIGVRSVTARQVITQQLYVDGGATWAGTVAAPKLETDVLDAGQAWVGVLGNPDGGEVYAPAGLSVDPGSVVCLNAPTCSLRVYASGNTIVLLAPAGTSITDGLTTQGIIEGGSLQPNSVELVGGATSVIIRAASGTGATPDAGLELAAGGPNGRVNILRDAGIQTAMTVFRPWQLAEVPFCTTELRGAKLTVLWPGLLPDGGEQAQEQYCNGAHWVETEFTFPVFTEQRGGNEVFYEFRPRKPGYVRSIEGAVSRPGNGAQPFQVIVRQGPRVMCTGGALCDDPIGTIIPLTCTDPRIFAGDGGLTTTVYAEVDAGCAQTPAANYTLGAYRIGYPDVELWSPPP